MDNLQEQDGLKPENPKVKILKIKSFCKVCKRENCNDNCLQQLKEFNEGYILNPKISKLNFQFFTILLLKIPLMLFFFYGVNYFFPTFFEIFIEIFIDFLELILTVFANVIWFIRKMFGTNDEETNDPIILDNSAELDLFLKIFFVIYMGIILFGVFRGLYEKEFKTYYYYRKKKKFMEKGYQLDYSLYAEKFSE